MAASAGGAQLERGLLEALARKELQALAKARGVKANQKSGAIVEELLELARGAAFLFVDEEEEEAPAAGAARRRSSAPAPEAAASSSSSSSRRASCAARQSQGESGSPAAAANRSARKSRASKSSTPAESAAAAASPVSSRKRAAERDPSPAASSTKRRASRSATQQQQQGEQSRHTPEVFEVALSGATPSRKRAAECEPEASVAAYSPPPASAAKKRRLSIKEKENSLEQAVTGAYARTAAKVAPKAVSQATAKSAIKARFDQAHERLFQTQRSIAGAKTPSTRLATQRKQHPTTAKTLARAATLNDKLAAAVPAFAPSAPVLALADKQISVAVKTTVASEAAKRAPAVTAPAEPKARPPRTKFNLADSLKRPITWKMKSGKLA
jgi:hypothetical protein